MPTYMFTLMHCVAVCAVQSQTASTDYRVLCTVYYVDISNQLIHNAIQLLAAACGDPTLEDTSTTATAVVELHPI
jgi:hypothetical protein